VKLSHLTVFGGVNINPQIHALQRGTDVLIATPGRLLDLANQRCVSFEDVEVFVLDEADRMLDMGFINDVRKIVSRLPHQRQSLLFSATMPPAIQELSASMVRNPQRVEVTPAATTVERIDQQVVHVDQGKKRAALVHFINAHPEGLVLVFVRMKHMANRLVESLAKDGIRAEAIHGNKSQAARQRALENFRTGRSRVLVATDIAARGIDVKGISLVIQHDLPEEPDSYVHRIGRTARAGKDGKAIALCGSDERGLLRDIQRTIRMDVPVLGGLAFSAEVPAEETRHRPQGGHQPREGRPGGNRGFRSRPARRGNRPPAHGAAGSRFSRGGMDRR
jgi:ATP-dependent RNA helicase RhlE